MAQRKRETHSSDTPRWKATKAARDAVDARDRFLASMSYAGVFTQFVADQMSGLFAAYVADYERQGFSHQDAVWHSLIALNMNEPIPDPQAALADPSWYLAYRMIASSVDTIRTGSLYVPTPDLHTQILAATDALEYDDLALMRTDDLPSPKGVVMFDEPLLFERTPGTAPDPITAISWRLATIQVLAHGLWTTSDAVVATAWVSWTHEITRDIYAGYRDAARDVGEQFPVIGPYMRAFRALDPPPGVRELSHDELVQQTAVADVGGRDGHYTPGGAITGTDIATWLLSYVMATSRLIAQPRQAEARIFRDGVDDRARQQPHHDVRLIQARPSTPAAAPGTHPGPAPKYSYQWPVRMHKVRHWYPKQQIHRVRFRGPYIKGPAGAPFRESTKVNVISTDDD